MVSLLLVFSATAHERKYEVTGYLCRHWNIKYMNHENTDCRYGNIEFV